MASLNKVQLIGNLGADPETRYSQGGAAITNFRVATTDTWNDKQSGEKQERTEWHRIVTFGKLADIVGEYAKKGRQVYVEGSLRTNKYTDKEGVERYSTDIVAEQVTFLGANTESTNHNPSGNGQGAGNGRTRETQGRSPSSNASASRSGSSANGRSRSNGNAPASGNGSRHAPSASDHRGDHDGGGFDDDIPF